MAAHGTPPRYYGDETDVTAIQLAQRILSELGLYAAKIDGIFDSATASAVRRFQARQLIRESGLLDNVTLTALRLVSNKSEPG